MAHFAKLDENNFVESVVVISNIDIIDKSNKSEQAGIDFLTSLHGHTLWKQTSYNGNIRKNYAGIGYTYDASRDAFIPPKIWESWTLNETTCQWEPPVAYPTVDPENPKIYGWFEPNQQWIEITGPTA